MENRKLHIKHLIRKAKDIKLSDKEKVVLRSQISEFMSYNPIRGDIKAPREKRYISVFTLKHFMRGAVAVLVISVLTVGSGVSYAAQKALPGDALYSIKTNFNEEVKEKLAFTPEAKAEIKAGNIQTRLEETQELIKKESLTVEKKAIVEAKIEEHIEELSEQIEDLSQDGKVEAVLKTTSQLSPVLKTHKEVLTKQQADEPALVQEDTQKLIEKIERVERAVAEHEEKILEDVEVVIEQQNTQKVDEVKELSMKVFEQASEKVSKLRAEYEESQEAIIDEMVEEIKNDVEPAISEELDLATNEMIEEITEEELTEDTPAEMIEEELTEIKPEEVSEVSEITIIKGAPINELILDEPTTEPSKDTEPTALLTEEAEEVKEALLIETEEVVRDEVFTETEIVKEEIIAEEPLVTTETEEPEEVINEEPAVVTESPITSTEVGPADTLAKLEEAEALLFEAKALINDENYAEALDVSQQALKIAGEIETYTEIEEIQLGFGEVSELPQGKVAGDTDTANEQAQLNETQPSIEAEDLSKETQEESQNLEKEEEASITNIDITA